MTTRLPGNWSRTSTHAISVPATALMAAVASEISSVKRSALTAWRGLTACQNASRPPSSERATTAASGSRTMTLSHSIDAPIASPPLGTPAPGAPASDGEGDAHEAVDTPASSSIFATEPFSGSNIVSLTFFQPPRSRIVNSLAGSGNFALCSSKTSWLTGR